MTPPTDEARAGEPRTEPGRDMLSWWTRHNNPKADEIRAAILAIEREAAAAPVLDVERLAESLAAAGWDAHPVDIVAFARVAAAEYARLSESAPSTKRVTDEELTDLFR